MIEGRPGAGENPPDGQSPGGPGDPPTGGGGPSPNGTGGGPYRRNVTVVNPLGLHFRVADRFSRAAKRFECAVTVWNGDTRADGKSPMELLLLVALPGAELTLETAGPDAAAAIDPLADILAAPSGEDYTI
jgi:phosphocarrier protein HPr